MPRSSLVVICVLIGLSLAGCASQANYGLLGTFVETHKRGIVYTDIEEYSFFEDGRFRYKLKSGEIASSKVGFGDFNIEAEKLILQFKQQDDLEQSTVSERTIPSASSDKYHYRFEVKDVTGRPILGANVVLLGLDVPFIGVATDHQGNASLHTPKYHRIHGFRVSMPGYEQIAHQIVKGDFFYEVVLVEKFGHQILMSKIEKPFRKRGRKIQIGGKTFVLVEPN